MVALEVIAVRAWALFDARRKESAEITTRTWLSRQVVEDLTPTLTASGYRARAWCQDCGAGLTNPKAKRCQPCRRGEHQEGSSGAAPSAATVRGGAADVGQSRHDAGASSSICQHKAEVHDWNGSINGADGHSAWRGDGLTRRPACGVVAL